MAYKNVNSAAAVPPYLHIASGLSGQAFTFSCWVKDISPNNHNHASAYTTVGVANVSDTSAPGVEGQFGSPNAFFGLGDTDNGPEDNVGSTANTTAWIFVAWTINSSGASSYYWGNETTAPSVLATATLSGTISDLYVGHPYSPDESNGKYSSVKAWKTNLTSTEILAEYNSKAPVKTASLYTYLSCDNGSTLGADQSGLGNNWTNVAGGTGTWTMDTDQPSLFGGSTFTVTPSDTVAVTDALAPATQYERDNSDTVSVTDSIGVGRQRDEFLTDSISVTDFEATSFEYGRTLSDTASITDSLATATQYERDLSDTASTTDGAILSSEYGRSGSDSCSVTDSSSIGLELGRSDSDTVGVTDGSSTAFVYERDLTDSSSITDSLLAATQYERDLADSVSITDSIDASVVTPSEIDVSVSDAVTVGDLLLTATQYERDLADSVLVTELLVAQTQYERDQVDALSLVDATALGVEAGRAANDTLSTSDDCEVSLVTSEIDVVVGDACDLTDQLATEAQYIRALLDALVLGDTTTIELIQPGSPLVPLSRLSRVADMRNSARLSPVADMRDSARLSPVKAFIEILREAA
jgi:hypothetical protein